MNLEDLRRLREIASKELEMRSQHRRFRVVVCMGTSGLAKGSREVMDAFVREIERRELEDVEVAATGSSGVEDLEPIVTIEERDRDPVVYAQLTADVARKIVAEHIIGGQRVASHVLQRQLPGEVK